MDPVVFVVDGSERIKWGQAFFACPHFNAGKSMFSN
jgi:hypothetical protein